EMPYTGDPRVVFHFKDRAVHFVLGQHFLQLGLGVGHHGTKFIKLEDLPVSPHPVLGEDGACAGAVDPDHQRHDRHGDGQHDQGQQRKENILRTAYHPVAFFLFQKRIPVKPIASLFAMGRSLVRRIVIRRRLIPCARMGRDFHFHRFHFVSPSSCSSVIVISRSQIRSAAGRWVIRRTVLSVISFRFCNTLCSVSSSRALVASSKIRMGRSEKTARAMAIRCICPSDKPAPRSPSWVSNPRSPFSTNESAHATCNARSKRSSCAMADGSPKATTSRMVPLMSWLPWGT